MYPDIVIVIRPGWTTNRYGDKVADWRRATRSEVAGVSVQPVGAEQRHDETRSPTREQVLLVTRPGVDVDITPTDRIEHLGLAYEITGVRAWTNQLTGAASHLEISLQRITG